MLLVKGAEMPHMVIFRDAEGRPGYHHADGIDEAVRFVEHLRNEQHVSDARVFSMQEVPLEFKTYYRVEVTSPVAESPVDEPVAAEVEAENEVEAEAEPELNGAVPAASGRFGLFGRN